MSDRMNRYIYELCWSHRDEVRLQGLIRSTVKFRKIFSVCETVETFKLRLEGRRYTNFPSLTVECHKQN